MGWGVVVASIGFYVAGVQLGWREFVLASATGFILIVMSLGFAVGKPLLQVAVDANPRRVTVGNPTAGELLVTNASRRRLLPLRIELPVGRNVGLFEVPSLSPGGRHEDVFVVPTTRRSVVRIGPAQAVRGDPLGLVRRQAATAGELEVFVHPRVIALDPLSAGMLRDLEGQTTPHLSSNDMAFHTLRDYVVGDDWRHVHWRSSAKANRVLVRQFLDTRRSRLSVVLDTDSQSYRDDDEFELAVSAAGSIAVTAAREDREIAIVAGSHATDLAVPQLVLDTLARVEFGDESRGLRQAAPRCVRLAPDTTVAVFITGSVVPFSDLRAATAWFGPDVTCFAIRAEPHAPAGITTSGGMTVVALRELGDLRRLLALAVNV